VQDGEKPAHGQHTHAPIHPASPRKLISSRSGLFGAVFDEIVARRVDAVAMDADDLPGYAARLYDQHLATAAPRVGPACQRPRRPPRGHHAVRRQAALPDLR